MMFGRTQYDYNASQAGVTLSRGEAPLELDEARHAVGIAEIAGATDYAPDALQKAKTSLRDAEELYGSKGDRKAVIQDARDAVQNAADARHIALTRIVAERDAAEKAREAQATASAQAAQQEADIDRQRAELQAQRDQQARVQAQQDSAAAQLKAQQDAAAAAQAQRDAAKRASRSCKCAGRRSTGRKRT